MAPPGDPKADALAALVAAAEAAAGELPAGADTGAAAPAVAALQALAEAQVWAWEGFGWGWARSGAAPRRRPCFPSLLPPQQVTTALLMATSAGKRVRKLAKSGCAPVADAAAAVVAAWKKAVVADAAATTPSSGAKRAPECDAAAGAGAGKKAKAEEAPAATPAPTAAAPHPTTGDATRDRAIAALASALALVPDAHRGGGDPTAVAVEVEAAARADAGGGAAAARYKGTLRRLLFNLKDGANPGLRRRVVSGELGAGALVAAPAEALASDARKKGNDAIRDAALFEANVSAGAKLATTDQFQCGKCRQR